MDCPSFDSFGLSATGLVKPVEHISAIPFCPLAKECLNVLSNALVTLNFLNNFFSVNNKTYLSFYNNLVERKKEVEQIFQTNGDISSDKVIAISKALFFYRKCYKDLMSADINVEIPFIIPFIEKDNRTIGSNNCAPCEFKNYFLKPILRKLKSVDLSVIKYLKNKNVSVDSIKSQFLEDTFMKYLIQTNEISSQVLENTLMKHLIQTDAPEYSYICPTFNYLNLNIQFPKLKGNEKILLRAKKAAMFIKVTRCSLPNSGLVSQYIQEISSKMAEMNPEEIKPYIKRNLEKIITVLEECKKIASTDKLIVGGHDAINREFLTNERILPFLSDSGFIIALIALHSLAPQHIVINEHKETKTTITIYSMLFYGLKNNNLHSLESMPISHSDKDLNHEVVKEYLRRKEIKFIFMIRAICEAYEKITKHKSTRKSIKTIIEQKYDLKKYSILIKPVLDRVLQKISNAKTNNTIEQLLNGAQNVSFESRQFIERFCKRNHIGFKVVRCSSSTPRHINFTDGFEPKVALPFNGFIDKLNKSYDLLNPTISHDVDRLHLLCALMDDTPYARFLDGKYSMREIYLCAIEKISKAPSIENAIMAEQFYVRLLMILGE